MHEVDVVVIGAGTMGSAALWQLSRRTGLKVLGIEQFGRVHTYGSFTGESRLFRTAAKEGALFVPLLREARLLWRELEQESGREIYLETGALSIGPGDSDPMRVTRRVVEDFSLEHRSFTARQLAEAYPQFKVHDDDAAILDLHAGALRPEVAVAAGLQLAGDNGADLWFNTAVLAVERYAGHTLLRTTRGTVRTRKLVVTAGSWTTRLMPELDDLVTVRPLGLTWFMPRSIRQFQPDRFPVFMRDIFLRDGSNLHLFGAPSLDGFSVKVSPGLLWEDVRSPDQVPTRFTREQLIHLGQLAQAFIPDLYPEPTRASVHHDSFTAANVPVMQLDEAGDAVVLTGLCGNGFKFAPVYGKMLADLVLDGTSELYRPEFSVASHRERADAASTT